MLIKVFNRLTDKFIMMNKIEIEASPQNIFDTDFKLSTKYPNKVKFLVLKKKPFTLLDDIDEGISLVQLPSEIALLDANKEKILYYMQFQKRKLFGHTAITQIKLWSDPTSHYTQTAFKLGMRITAYVFFNKLLSQAEILLSDAQQTAAGRRFWESRVADALNLQLNVYIIDQLTKDKMLIKDLDHFQDIKDSWWGDDEKYLAKRIAITKTKIWF